METVDPRNLETPTSVSEYEVPHYKTNFIDFFMIYLEECCCFEMDDLDYLSRQRGLHKRSA